MCSDESTYVDTVVACSRLSVSVTSDKAGVQRAGSGKEKEEGVKKTHTASCLVQI